MNRTFGDGKVDNHPRALMEIEQAGKTGYQLASIKKKTLPILG
jgi:hypothetical protein